MLRLTKPEVEEERACRAVRVLVHLCTSNYSYKLYNEILTDLAYQTVNHVMLRYGRLQELLEMKVAIFKAAGKIC